MVFPGVRRSAVRFAGVGSGGWERPGFGGPLAARILVEPLPVSHDALAAPAIEYP